jgi:hypothetical protein
MPDTAAYLILGLVAVFGIMGFYVLTLVTRFRSAEKDIQTIDQLKD